MNKKQWIGLVVLSIAVTLGSANAYADLILPHCDETGCPAIEPEMDCDESGCTPVGDSSPYHNDGEGQLGQNQIAA